MATGWKSSQSWQADRGNIIDTNPALTAFAASLGSEFVFGQILIRPHQGGGFELRHVADRYSDASSLPLLAENELRDLAQFSGSGAFRPLKSAPTLRAGWRIVASNLNALGSALNQLYPGAVADWFAAKSPHPPVTGYREFTNRQTGMYRITTFLTDPIAAAAIRACCPIDFCLKRRLWSVEDQPVDPPSAKSAIPCLEPCALMLEFARKIARLEQDPSPTAPAGAELTQPDPPIPESDFNNPRNPRRLRFKLEKASLSPTLSKV